MEELVFFSWCGYSLVEIMKTAAVTKFQTRRRLWHMRARYYCKAYVEAVSRVFGCRWGTRNQLIKLLSRYSIYKSRRTGNLKKLVLCMKWDESKVISMSFQFKGIIKEDLLKPHSLILLV